MAPDDARTWAYQNLTPNLYTCEDIARTSDDEILLLVDAFKD